MIEETTAPHDFNEADDTITRQFGAAEPVSWESFGLTNPGKVRKVNEDAFALDNANRLWVVADGMGGHSAGDVASQSIAAAFTGLDTTDLLSQTATRIEATLVDLNQRFQDMANRGGEGVTIGSTVVVCAFRQGWMLVLWVGDSRIYRWRDGALHQLTQDHSQVEELISRGLLLRENAESHPAANVVTRAIGAAGDVYVDLDYCDAQPGDRFLLCSDGLTKEVPVPEIRRLLGQDASAEQICEALIATTLAADARDNVTVVVAKANTSENG
jgi:serine/threonine protein phosphatase PrpC